MNCRAISKLVPLILPLLTVSCVSNRTLASNAVSYNLAVETAQNRMLFLNVIRASERTPMYLTDISKVTGSIKADVTTSLAVPFAGTGAGKNVLTPGTTYSLNPTFDVNVLSTQEFMRGFLQPIKNETLGYYLDQGWPPELLFHLFVRQVRIKTATGDEKVYDNYPNKDDPCKMQRFADWVYSLVQHDLRTESKPVSKGEAVTGTGDLNGIVNALKEAGVRITEENGRYRLQKVGQDLVLMAKDPASGGHAHIGEAAPNCTYTSPTGTGTNDNQKQEALELGQMRVTQDSNELILIMRSPEGLLYYLGELMRMESYGYIPEVCIQGHFEPIFFATSGKLKGCEAAAVASYEGTEYYIPKSPKDQGNCTRGDFRIRQDPNPGCIANRSMQSFSLISQLIAMQKSAKDLPTTDVVRVIGQ